VSYGSSFDTFPAVTCSSYLRFETVEIPTLAALEFGWFLFLLCGKSGAAIVGMVSAFLDAAG
jgi:hypothetical protein